MKKKNTHILSNITNKKRLLTGIALIVALTGSLVMLNTSLTKTSIAKVKSSDTEDMSKSFVISKINKNSDVYKRIKGKSYKKNPYIKLSDLRYITFLHYNYDHKIQSGEIIVNKKIASKVCTIFKKLYKKEYEIKSAHLIDKYFSAGSAEKADDASCDAGNSSGFCYRMVVRGKKLSKHALGLAVDINTRENPYLTKKNGKWYCSSKTGRAYIDRNNRRKHMIDHNDYAYKLFKKYGFKWGGDWNSVKDYQHFEI